MDALYLSIIGLLYLLTIGLASALEHLGPIK